MCALTACRCYNVNDLSEHYVRCGHRMSAEESERVFSLVSDKYSRNPQIEVKEAEKRLSWLKKRREWATKGLYPENGQPLMEKFVSEWRPGRRLSVPGRDAVDRMNQG